MYLDAGRLSGTARADPGFGHSPRLPALPWGHRAKCGAPLFALLKGGAEVCPGCRASILGHPRKPVCSQFVQFLVCRVEGLETRVHARTDAAGKTTGWTATAFLPWSGFGPLPSAHDVGLPPQPGDAWRVNVFRIKRPGGPEAPETDAVFAAWSPPSVRSFHDPGAFRRFIFQAAP